MVIYMYILRNPMALTHRLSLSHLQSRMGLHAFALTDHDTISGLKYARPAAEEAGIELVPGIELSTTRKEKKLHIL